MNNEIKNYIFEQILILEKNQELLEENKVLAGLSAIALAGAAYFAQGFLQNDNITTNDVANKAVKSQKLSQKQLLQIKKGANLAQEMISKGASPEKISVSQEDPSVSNVFKALFNNKMSKNDMSSNDMPIASAEDINLDEMFFFTQEELDKYFDLYEHEDVLTLDDGSSLLDMDIEELNESLADPSSKELKLIAREILSHAVIEKDFLKATESIFNEFNDDPSQLSTALRQLEESHEKEFYRIKAVKNWLEKNVTSNEAESVLKDILRSSKHINSIEDVNSWLEDYSSGEKVNDEGQFIDGYSSYEDNDDDIELDKEFNNRARRDTSIISDFFSDE